jgi:hypothetical protein
MTVAGAVTPSDAGPPALQRAVAARCRSTEDARSTRAFSFGRLLRGRPLRTGGAVGTDVFRIVANRAAG